MSAVRYYSLENGTGIRLVAEGEITGDILADGNRRLIEQHEALFRQCDYWFSDFSLVRGDAVNVKDARGLSGAASRSSKRRITIAMCAPSDLGYGMARMWQGQLVRQDGWNIGIFRSLPESVAWLKVQLGREVDLDQAELLFTLAQDR